MPFDEREETQLIDVSAIDDLPPEETTGTAVDRFAPAEPAGPDLSPPPEPSAVAPGGKHPATVSERFAAAGIDAAILWCAYWLAVGCANRLLHGTWVGMVPTRGWKGAAFHGLFGLAVLLYYTITEAVLLATPGKLACGLTIRRVDGSEPRFFPILIRTLCRPIDLVVGLLWVEWTAHAQRLGDLLAGTVVLTARPSTPAPRPVTASQLAGTPGRLAAGLIDTAILCTLAGGLTLLLTPQRPIMSHWLLVTLPITVTLFVACMEFATETSAGKWLCGYRLRRENGTRIGLHQAVLRTLFLPVDFVGLGPLAIALSPRRQRLGDAVAGTVVLHAPRRWPGAIGCVLSIACASAVAYVGWQNPGNWGRNPAFQWTFVPRLDAYPDWPIATRPPEPFAITQIRFAAGDPKTLRPAAVFLPGESVFLVFEVHGYTKVDREVWIQEDLAVRNPDGSFGLRQENLIEYNKLLRTLGGIELQNNVNLPLDAAPGKYAVFIHVRDRLAKTFVAAQAEFEVKGDVPPPEAAADAGAIHELVKPPTPPSAAAPVPGAPTPPMTGEGPKVMPAPSLPVPVPPPTSPYGTPGPTPPVEEGPKVLPGPSF